MSKLLSPVRIGALDLKNRVFMAPLTRARADAGHLAGELNRIHYSQRASAGLIFTEATMTAADGCAFIAETGIYSQAHADAYAKVVDAVHAAGGRIALQLWHPGRASHPVLNNGAQPISSTDRPITTSQIATPQGLLDYPAPRRLRTEELPGIVAQFRAGAEFARKAGFDAIQVHGAHGYLIDQFLRDSVNDRNDEYGGSLPNRARLLFQIVDACAEVFGAERTGLRISPRVAFNDIADSDPAALVQYVARESQARKLAYLELRHEQFDLPEEQALARIAREHFHGALLRNGGFDEASGEAALADGADAIVYGKAFIANPDLPERFRRGAPLTPVDFSTLYTPGPKGYTDYPFLEQAAVA